MDSGRAVTLLKRTENVIDSLVKGDSSLVEIKCSRLVWEIFVSRFVVALF